MKNARKKTSHSVPKILRQKDILLTKKVVPSSKSSFKKIIFSYHTLRALGLFLLIASVIFKYHDATVLSFANDPISHPVQQKFEQPDMIVIKSLGIQLPVSEAHISYGIWQISDEGASHLDTSANPGEKGSIIIYAHNLNSRFGYLPAIHIGTDILIRTKDYKWHTYRVVKTQIVNPTQTEVLDPQHYQELILYTCYGFADLKRFVVRAVPA